MKLILLQAFGAFAFLAPGLAAAAQSPTVHTAEAVPAATGGDATLVGIDLDLVTGVLVDGVPAPIVKSSHTVLVASVPSGPPGARELTLLGAVPVVLPGAIDRLPRTTASSYGLGACVDVAIDVGAAGNWVLAAGLGTLPGPLAIAGFHHGIELDPAGLLLVIESGATAGSEPIARMYDLPADAGLVGATLFLQSLALPASAPASFSDVAAAPLALAPPHFRIESCSLGCGSAGPGTQISCGISDVFANNFIWLDFPTPIDPASITPFTAQLIELGTGIKAGFEAAALPGDPTRLCLAPLVTMDASGQTVFGLKAGSTYQLMIPGENQDPGGPWLTSICGAANEDRLLCHVQVSLGFLDLVAGPPKVAVTVTTVTAFDALGNPLELALDVPADGSVDVALDTNVVATFFDVLKPASVLDPLGVSPMEVLVDLDGDPTTTGDQSAVAGAFTLKHNACAASMTLTFDPAADLPATGGGPLRVLVRFQPGIVDLVGLPLVDPGVLSFAPRS